MLTVLLMLPTSVPLEFANLVVQSILTVSQAKHVMLPTNVNWAVMTILIALLDSDV